MTFSDFFRHSRPVLSFEFFPPKQEEQIPQVKELMRGLLSSCAPDFMTVTYGAGGGTRTYTLDLVKFIAQELRCPAVAHLACLGHSLDEIEAVLQSYEQFGISHLLALRGDPPRDHPAGQPVVGAFSNARDLAGHISRRGGFSLAVAGYPEVHHDAASPQADLQYLKEKVDAGGQLIITQLFFDPAIYFGFRDRAVRQGIQVPILPGIMPIGNVAQVKRFTQMCGASIPERVLDTLHRLEADPDAVLQFGIEYAHEMCEALLKGGAPGLHLYTLNRSNQVAGIVKLLSGIPEFGR